MKVSLLALLGLAARHGRIILVAGLAAGIALPDLALAMRPWLQEMVAGLLFFAALHRLFGAEAEQRVDAALSVGDRISFMVGGAVVETMPAKGLSAASAHFATYVGV